MCLNPLAIVRQNILNAANTLAMYRLTLPMTQRNILNAAKRFAMSGNAVALLHEEGLRRGRHMVSFNYHTKICHEISIPHPQLV